MVTIVLLVGLAAFILYNNYMNLPPSNTPPPPAPAPAVPEKAPVAALHQETTPPPATVPQPQPQAQTAEEVTPKPQPAPAAPVAPQAPPEQAETGPSPVATVPPPAPQAGETPGEPESAQSTTYKVSPDDGLLKIVSTYYPDDKDIGYDAVILANPRINNEDVIYPGQTLTLPKIDKNNNIITIGGKEYFKIYGQYYNSLDVARATAKLKELQLQFVVRETEIPDEGKIYRVFLGAYGSPDELKKAMAQLGNN
jgi:hypothetical protein